METMEDVRFEDLIFATEGNYNIKLGMKDGTGFIFCGTTEQLKYKLDELNEEVRKRLEEKVKNAEKRLNGMFVKPWHVSRYAKETYNSTGEFGTVEGYNEWLNGYFDELRKAEQRIDKARQKLADFIPLADRVIMEHYKSIDEPNTFIILISGRENGDYWTTNEYQNGEVKEE